MKLLPVGAISGGVAFILASGVAGVAQFGYHLLVSRALGPEAYAALGAILGVLLVATVPLAAIELVIVTAVSRIARVDEAGAGRVPSIPGWRSLLTRGIRWAGWVGAASLLGGLVLVRYLHLPSFWPAAIVAMYMALATIGAVMRGVLLGAVAYRQVAWAALWLGAAKLAAGAGAIWAGFGLVAALSAIVAAEGLHVAALIWGSRDGWRRSHPGLDRIRMRYQGTMLTVAALVGLWIIGAGDVVMARALFPTEAGGYFAAGAQAAHALLFIPQTMMLVAYPLFVRMEGEDLRRVFRLVAGATLGTVGLVAAAMVLIPERVVGVMFGDEYQPAAQLVGVLAVSAGAVGATYIITHLHLASALRISLISWAGVVALAVLAIVGPETPRALAFAVAGVNCTVALVAGVTGSLSWGNTTRMRRVEHLSGPASTEVTVVVPFYNPGPAVVDTVEAVLSVFEEARYDVEVIAVSDGSNDGSAERVADLTARRPEVRLIRQHNQGKGAALREGMSRAGGAYIGILDADGSSEPACCSTICID